MIVAITRTSDGEAANADSATLQITAQNGTLIVPPVVVLPTTTGHYSYSTGPLTAGNYTAQWTFAVAGYPDDVVSRVFQVENPVSQERGITLAEIERATAARIGPYDKMLAYNSSSSNALIVRKLISTTPIGDYEDRYILRRGLLSDGSLVPNFTDDDRSRIVSEYTSEFGRLSPDSSWTTTPALNEVIELHYFDPDDLREIVLQGLRRCFFWDVLEVTSTTTLTEFSLSAFAPWITRTAQIRAATHGRYLNSLHNDRQNVEWFRPYQKGGEVWVQMTGPNAGTLRFEVLRPHFTYVNDEDTMVGPNHDLDVLHVDREYAARAGHISAWMLHTPRMAPLANQGLAISMEQAAQAFTVSSLTFVKTDNERIHHRFTRGDVLDYAGQVGNL